MTGGPSDTGGAGGYGGGNGGAPGLVDVSVNNLTDGGGSGCSCGYASSGGNAGGVSLLLLGAALFRARRRRAPARDSQE